MAGSAALDVNTFLDDRAMTRKQWTIVLLSVLILILDGFDTTMMGFIAPALIEDWGLSREALGPLMMSGLVGLSIGALVAGPLADRIGRKSIITLSVLFFGLWSLASAFSTDLTTLTVLRFLTGVGLGASMPNTSTLVAEYSPLRRRALLVTSAYSGFALGGALGGFASEHLIQALGWRSVFVVGGVLPMLLAVLLWWQLPESIRFLVHSGKSRQRIVTEVNRVVPGLVNEHTSFFNSEQLSTTPDTAGKGIFGLILGELRVGTLMLWTSMFMGLLLIYLLGSWLPIIARSAGLSLSEAAIIGAMLQLGGVLGNFTVGMKMDRWDKNHVLSLVMFGCSVFCLLIALAPATPLMLGTLVFGLGYCINSCNTGCYAMATHFYPTSVRATGVSWTSGIGRLGAIFGAGFGAVMMGQNWTLQETFLFLCCPPLISCMAMQYKRLHERRRARQVAAAA
ncbi:aromatic acid/H+ symport family MFS transporter [Pseudomonas poae]|uniref:MFS transporter n=1 Tax=Pseudomonas poae TaxID=200451 RepID=UPI0030D00387